VVAQGPLSETDFERMDEGGIGFVRVVVPWGTVDPGAREADFDFAAIDPVVEGAARNGLEPLLDLIGTAPWAAELDGCADDCGGLAAPRSPETIAGWAELAAAASERYGPGGTFWREHPDVPEVPVRTWQIWNEQNATAFYAPQPDPAGFARLVVAAETEIRARDSGATVILGGMHADAPPQTPPATGFLRSLYEIDGIEEHFDGVAVHPYAGDPDQVPAQLDAMKSEIDRADDDASLWVTEIGWASSEGEDSLEKGPEGQADSLTAAYEQLTERREEWNLQGVVWFSWRDQTENPVCKWCPYSGLFTEDTFEPKPAWEALTEFTGGS
jgi:hypothetical protein